MFEKVVEKARAFFNIYDRLLGADAFFYQSDAYVLIFYSGVSTKS